MTTPAPTLDLSGLSPEAVRRLQELAELFRTAETPPPARPGPPPLETPEERVARFKEWVASHTSRNPNMDDSRDSIYD